MKGEALGAKPWTDRFDLNDALIWLLAIEILGLAAFPLVFVLFRRLPDRGYAFAKPLALLLGSYVLWVSGLAHILPNSQATIIGIVVAMALISAVIAKKRWREMRAFLYEQRHPLIISEMVFLGFYFMWLVIVSGSPDINHTEKPMDFAFLNAILQSSYFPPEDPWLAGHSISYYYFGHMMVAFITKLTAIPSNISYNLAVALVPAMVAAGAFSLVYCMIRLSGAALKKAVLFALVAPLLLCLVGTMEGILEFVHANGWGADGFWQWISIKGLDGSGAADARLFPDGHWWWWRGTRIIDTVVNGVSLDYTITEFPFFSFLLGDLHPHVSALPVLLLILALGLNFFVDRNKVGPGWIRSHLWEAGVIALSLGSLAFINPWDYPVFAVMMIILVLLKSDFDWRGDRAKLYVSAAAIGLPVLIASVLLFLPFYLTFDSQVSGLSPLGDFDTRPFFFLLIWAPFLTIVGAYLIKLLWNTPILSTRDPQHLSIIVIFTLLPFLIWTGVQLLGLWAGIHLIEGVDGNRFVSAAGEIGARFLKLLPAMAIIALISYSLLARAKNIGERPVIFSLLPLCIALYLMMGAELFFVIDLFGNRMNTVFKIYFQSWLLLSIVSAYGLYYVLSRSTPLVRTGKVMSWRFRAFMKRQATRIWLAVVVLMLVASAYYSIGAALDRADTSGDRTLDGLDFLRNGSASGEYEAILWLRDDAPKGRLLEAVGDDYSNYGRISSSTGFPTMLGWKFHEYQWRGSQKPYAGREELVEDIYSSDDPAYVAMLLDEAEIRYVYVGARERNSYGAEHLVGFTSFLQPVFDLGTVIIYEVAPATEPTTLEGTYVINS